MRVMTSATATPTAQLSVALRPRAKTSDYLYDTDRTRILRRDPAGSVTLTLGPLTEITHTDPGSTYATRYYAHGTTHVAVRNSAYLEWTLADEQGSLQTSVDYTTGTINHAYYTPYGALDCCRYAPPTTAHRWD